MGIRNSNNFKHIATLNTENQNNKIVSAPPTHLSFEFMSTALTQLQKAQNEKCRQWRQILGRDNPD